ncbi:retron system putative HNH endonuclease [Undibacterium umbellatum]|uniref:TIGR02646 family protein n=1 Tax=Undibacterium umbellatum TaxID=2762300 RepID=A0ABR6ZF25_9BURK|nr:retron system putative HNH endonuclease [Undibacterium umbellatum]MBC3910181.1 TIGR02646 family protein [Undibacterium umbellatum]
MMPYFHISEPLELEKFRTADPNATWADLKATMNVNISVKNTVPKKGAGLCIYCEQKLIDKVDFQVEHFVPKKGDVNSSYLPGDPNWAIHWDNLLPACLGGTAPAGNMPSSICDSESRIYTSKNNISCGQFKGDKHPNVGFISPKEIPSSESLFLYEVDGQMKFNHKAKNVGSLDKNSIDKHIGLLNLNCERLKRARAKFALMLEDEFDVAQQSYEDVSELIEKWLTPNADGLLDQPFFSLILKRYKS